PAPGRSGTVRGLLQRECPASHGRGCAGALQVEAGAIRRGGLHAPSALGGLAAGAARRDVLAHGLARRLLAHPLPGADHLGRAGPLPRRGDVTAARFDDSRCAAPRRAEWTALPEPESPLRGPERDRKVFHWDRALSRAAARRASLLVSVSARLEGQGVARANNDQTLRIDPCLTT